MQELQGVGVLVTRPAAQALPLCRLLQAQGAVAHPFPTLSIEAVNGGDRLPRHEPFPMLIFTSANAVRFGTQLLAMNPAAVLAAIGPATARALELVGRRAAVTPCDGFDSEALLRQPDFQHIDGRHILIVTGKHGRALLREALSQRGATVWLAEVYERRRIVYRAGILDELAARFEAGIVQVITATSAEIAASLFDMASPALHRALQRAYWLVPNLRVASALRERDAGAQVLQAASAEDHDLVRALIRWRTNGFTS